MIFRLKVLIPLCALVGVLIYGLALWSPSLAKVLLESNIDGLSIDELQLDNQSEELRFSLRGQYGDDEGELASLGQGQLHLDKSPLGFGEFVLSANLEQLVIKKRLFTHLGEQVSSQVEEGGADQAKSGDDEPKEGFSIAALDHREVLDRIAGTRELKSERAIKDGKSSIKAMEQKWTQRVKDFKQHRRTLEQKKELWQKNWQQQIKADELKKEFDDLKAELETMKGQKFDPSNIEALSQQIQQLQQYPERIKGLKNKFSKLKDNAKNELGVLKTIGRDLQALKFKDGELKRDLAAIKDIKDNVLRSGEADLDLLKKELDPKAFDSAKIVRLLLGREWELKLVEYLGVLEKVMDVLPKIQGEASDEQEAQSSSDETTPDGGSKLGENWVSFPRENEGPKWHLPLLRYGGQALGAYDGENVPFEGQLLNLSSDETLLGSAPQLKLQGTLPKQGGFFQVEAMVSTVKKDPDHQWLKFKLNGRDLAGSSMGSSDLRIHFEQGSMNAEIKVDLSSGPNWLVEGKVSMADIDFVVDENVKAHMKAPLKSCAEQLLSKPLAFTYRFPGPLRFDSSLGDVAGTAFRSALSGVAKVEQQKLQQRWTQDLQRKLSRDMGDGPLKQMLSAGLPQLVKGLTAKAQSTLGLERQGQSDLGAIEAQNQSTEQLLAEALGLKGGREGLKRQFKDRLKQEAQKRAQALIQEKLSGKKGDPKDSLKFHKDDLKGLFKDLSGSKNKPADSTDKSNATPEKKAKEQLKEVLKGFPF